MKKTYVYANGEILAQHDGDVNASRYFYLHDRLGSVREVIDNAGSVVNYYTYDPFGQLAGGGETIENPFKFTGQYFDSETGQYYLRARMYDPILGRFTSRDPIIGKFQEPMSLHKYLYCFNEPVNHIDPDGRDLIGLLDATVTGTALYAQAIDLAAYASSSGDWRFFDLAQITIEFIPVGMTIAAFAPRDIGVLIGLTLVNTESDTMILGATGMSFTQGVFINPAAFFIYWNTMAFGETYLGIPFTDMADFAKWHGTWW